MDRKMLVIDTETGGLDPDVHSLLSIGAAVWSPGTIVDSIEVFISEDTVAVQPDALRKNHVDLVWLRDHGVAARLLDRLGRLVRRRARPR
jgi:DNA polymerase III epsilon subunit-like protein